MKKYILKFIMLVFIVCVSFLSIDKQSDTINANEITRSIALTDKNVKDEDLVNTYNFKKLKLRNGFTYKLFQDVYINDIANYKNVKIYFNLSKVSNDKLKKSIKSTVNLYNKLRGSAHRFTLTYSKPKSGFYYTNNVIQSADNYACDDAGWSYACANSSVMKINKKTLKASYNLQKRILFHEFLHVFGIDHVKQGTKNSAMDPAVDDGNIKFSYKHYPYDVSAWRMLNSPNITHKSKKGNTSKTNLYFLNVYPYKKSIKYKNKYKSIKYYYYSSKIRTYQSYDTRGKIKLKINYYRNGKRTNYNTYFSNGKHNESISYLINGIGSYKKLYYNNGKLKQFIDYSNSGKYDEIKNYTKYGKLLNDAEYYNNGVMESNEYYYDNGNLKEELDYNISSILIEDMKYYMSGFKNEESHYYDNGKLKQKIKYDEKGNKVSEENY